MRVMKYVVMLYHSEVSGGEKLGSLLLKYLTLPRGEGTINKKSKLWRFEITITVLFFFETLLT